MPLHIYTFTLMILLAYATLIFFYTLYKKDNGIMDIAYGPSFIVVSIALLIQGYLDRVLFLPLILLTALICVWGTRLAIRIYHKNKNKPEDFRYKMWREEWSKRGSSYFYVRSYLQVFVLQAVVVSFVLLPLTISYTYELGPFSLLSFVGLVLWICGFFFEAISDAELDHFMKTKGDSGDQVMKEGLWRYSRHPNYFGESLQWIGLAVLAFSVTNSLYVFISPFVITYLLLFVSGIPMLEKKWSGLAEWETYKAKTSGFIPWFPKRS